jgi:hypothetical protein
MNAYRVLVCGGRTYGTIMTDDGYYVPNKQEVDLLRNYLNELLTKHPDMIIIHGAAKGADSLAAAWARDNGVVEFKFPAEWSKYGKSAGFLRNTEMLESGKPDLVIGFPGSTGTAMMCKIAAAAGVEVIKVK